MLTILNIITFYLSYLSNVGTADVQQSRPSDVAGHTLDPCGGGGMEGATVSRG